MAFPDGWSHKWPIAINADSVISSPVADWPCLITDAHFPAGAWAQMQATGADLRFSLDADGATELYYDAPRLSVAGESAHLYVRVPSLASTADTTIYGWCGNGSATAPSAAWMQNTYPSDWAAFWPMEEGAGTTVGDRTTNGYDGALVDGPTWENGVTGSALSGGSPKKVNMASVIPLRPPFTIASRVYLTDLADGQIFVATSRRGGGVDRYSGCELGLNSLGKLWVNTGDNTGTSPLDRRGYWSDTQVTPVEQWLTVVGVCWTLDEFALFVNGTEVAGTIQGSASSVADGSPASLLYAERFDRYMHGLSESASVHSAAFDTDEVAIHHLMLSDPATFATAGELVPAAVKYFVMLAAGGEPPVGEGPQDYTTYTEVDVVPPDYITVTETAITMTDWMANNVDVLVYKDFGAGHFAGDFEHHLEYEAWRQDTGSYMGVWCLANTVDDIYGLQTGAEPALMVVCWGGIRVWLMTGNSEAYQEITGLSINVPYYLTLKRVAGVFTVYVYSDAARTVLVGSKSVADANAYRYLYAFASRNSGQTGDTCYGEVRNLDIVS